MEKMKSSLICPLCHSEVEIGVRNKGYSGHTENMEEIPKEGTVCSVRRLTTGKMRYGYWMKAYIPMCSNRSCFLHGLTKQFKSKEEAEEAWEERAKSW